MRSAEQIDIEYGAFELLHILDDSNSTVEDFKKTYNKLANYRKNFGALGRILPDDMFGIAPKAKVANYTLAAHAARRGNIGVLQFLAEQKTDFSLALHQAIFHLQIEALRFLLTTLPADFIRQESNKEDDNIPRSNIIGVHLAAYPVNLAIETRNYNIVSTLLNCESIEISPYIILPKTASWSSENDQKIFALIIKKTHQHVINDFITTNFTNALSHYSGLALMVHEGTFENLECMLNMANPFLVAEEAQKKFRAVSADKGDIYYHIAGNRLLNPNQKKLVVDYFNNLIFIFTGDITKDPQKYIKLISAMIPMEPEHIIDHYKWIALLEKVILKIKDNNPMADQTRDKLNALLGRVHLAQYIASKNNTLIHLTKAQECWDKITNPTAVSVEDSFHIVMHFTASTNADRKKKALTHALACARIGHLDSKAIYCRSTLGLGISLLLDEKEKLLVETSALHDEQSGSLEELEPLSALNDGVTPFALLESKSDRRNTRTTDFLSTPFFDKLCDDKVNELDLATATRAYLQDYPEAKQLTMLAEAKAPEVKVTDMKHSAMFSVPVETTITPIDDDTRKFINDFLTITDKYLDKNVKLFMTTENLVRQYLENPQNSLSRVQSICCDLESVKKLLLNLKNELSEIAIKNVHLHIGRLKLIAKTTSSQGDNEQYLIILNRIANDIGYIHKIIMESKKAAQNPMKPK